jgi:predicted phosphodiesterase
MRYGVISDIHANLEALNATLEEIDKLAVDKVICLGDIVGYGANPNECVEIIRERKIESIIGNHDTVACGLKEPDDFNQAARQAALWTRDTLTEENREFLRGLSHTRGFGDFIVVHGAISNPDLYLLSPYDAIPEFKLMNKERICFFGHTHVRLYFVLKDKSLSCMYDYEIKIDPKAKYLINPGSIGQPRDRDPRSSFLVYDDQRADVQFVRLEYDVSTAQEKIIKAGLDRRLADRLSVGM